MTTDDDARETSRNVKLAIFDLRRDLLDTVNLLDMMDTSCDANGILNDRQMVLMDLDRVFRNLAIFGRKTTDIQTGIINTQWPKAADYAEV